MFLLENIEYKNILNIETLHIPKSKITCILGGSGSGKSTLLKLFNKLITYDKGEIYYNGISLSYIPAIQLRRKVVMLSQNPDMFKGNIRDNLLIGLRFSEKPLLSDIKLKDMLSLVYLDKELDQDVENLSGGEKQRLALARVLLLDPEVLLLDEPSSALDEDTEYLVIKEAIDYSKSKNISVIMVTHSRKIAQIFGDHIIEIDKGKIIT